MPTFEETLGAVAGVEGWMTDEQARCLWECARALRPPARVVEIGSFRGRSMIVLASAADDGVELVAIDPHAGGDRGPQEIAPDAARGESDHERFLANLDLAGVASKVRHVRKMSSDAHEDVQGDIDLLYVDGAHRFRPARHDIVTWGSRVRPGGTMLIHDSFSSIGVTAAILTSLAFDSTWTYRGRVGSLARYDRRPAPAITDALRQLRELGWFVRNVAIKALIVARLGRLTRHLGHDSESWPY